MTPISNSFIKSFSILTYVKSKHCGSLCLGQDRATGNYHQDGECFAATEWRNLAPSVKVMENFIKKFR